MSRLLKALTLTLVLAALTFFTTGCGSSSAQFRVVDAIPDAPVNFDVAINTKNVFTGVSFESVEPSSGYQKVSSGSDSVEVFQTGTTTAVIPSTSLSFGGSSQYTVVLTGRYNSTLPPNVPTAVLLTDNNTAPTSGNVEFRIIHASPSTATVDIYIVPPGTDITNAPKTFSGLTFQQASPSYASLAGGTTYSVIATFAGTSQPIVSLNYNPGSAGAIATMVLADQPGGGFPPQWLPLTDVQ
jgi:hypothetical protein